jgi:CBS-domain-containing membrane protein
MRRSLPTRTVSEIMNRAPVTVRPELTVGEAARLLEAERRNEVPVLDAEGLLCGVVSALDLLRVLRPDAAVRPRLCTPRWVRARRSPGKWRSPFALPLLRPCEGCRLRQCSFLPLR